MSVESILKLYSETDTFEKLSREYYSPTNHIASGFLFNDDQELKKVYAYGGPCHAVVRHQAKNYDYCYTAVDPAYNSKGAVIYYDWLLNKSSLRDSFITKDPELAGEKGIIQTLNFNGPGWLAAAQLARLSTSEYKFIFKAVCKVLEEGYEIHPMLLLLCAQVSSLGISKANGHYTTATFPYSMFISNSHLPFCGGDFSTLNMSLLCNDSKLPNEVATHLKVSGSWNGSNSCFFNGDRATAISNVVKQNTIYNKPFQKEKILIGSRKKLDADLINSKPVEVIWSSAKDYFKKMLDAPVNINGSTTRGFLSFSALEQITKSLQLAQV